MPKFKVLHTDCRWSDADIERDILQEVDAEVTVALRLSGRVPKNVVNPQALRSS